MNITDEELALFNAVINNGHDEVSTCLITAGPRYYEIWDSSWQQDCPEDLCWERLIGEMAVKIFALGVRAGKKKDECEKDPTHDIVHKVLKARSDELKKDSEA